MQDRVIRYARVMAVAAGLAAGISAYASTGGTGSGYVAEDEYRSDAVITDGGRTCTVYGPGYGFALETPAGWTARVSDRDQEGRYATWYPIGKPWIMSDDVMYAFGIPKDDWVRGVEDAIEYDMEYYEESCPGYSAKEDPAIMTDGGKRAATVVDYYCDTVDSVAYIDEEFTVIVIAFSAGDEMSHKANHPAFEQLVGSYRYVGEIHK